MLLLIFFPPLIQWIWQCQPLKDSPFQQKLQKICERAGFKHPKLKVWTVMNQSLTAAIIGVIPPFRYVLFTKKLLHTLSAEAIEAILAHEIGHSYRKHLLIYPFVLFGFMVLTGILSLLFAQTIENTLNLEILLNPNLNWQLIVPLLFFLFYGTSLILYLRYVFGFFSRLFERQADLHVYALGVPPEHMIKALDELGVATGHTHEHPSWHHYSIQQRINFLHQTIQFPSLIESHNRKVKKILFAYFMALFVGACLLLSPWLPHLSPFSKIQQTFSHLSHSFNHSWNASLRYNLARKYQHDYRLTSHSAILQKTLEEAFESFDRGRTVEEINLIASQRLYKAGEVYASSILLTQIWQQMPSKDFKQQFLTQLFSFTNLLLQNPSINQEAIQQLQQEYERKMKTIKISKKGI
nr:M48 family metallopeptidase [Parachlamydia sp. AcF125]